ncbi:MAG: RNA polymerase sigma factor [Bacteroidetes bacterium]|nr:RNA polymerase sigma factor [Bacteroidota bacterium]
MSNYFLDDMTDEELITRLGPDQFTLLEKVLYKRYEKKVYNRCVGYLKDKALAHEFVQDIFIKVFEHLPQFRKSATFSTWLYSITVNHCIDYSRKKSKHHIIEYMTSEALPDIVDDLLPDEEEDESMYDRFMKVLARLPENHRNIIEKRYLQNKSIKTLQEELNLHESAVKMRVKRAREALLLQYYADYGKDIL